MLRRGLLARKPNPRIATWQLDGKDAGGRNLPFPACRQSAVRRINRTLLHLVTSRLVYYRQGCVDWMTTVGLRPTGLYISKW